MGFSPKHDNFSFFRIDYIKEVKILETAKESNSFKKAINEALPYCYMLNIDKTKELENFEMTLSIDEVKEKHILKKLIQEARGGVIEKIAPNVFHYKRQTYSTKEIMPWAKSFIGNIISIKGNNKEEIDYINEDLKEIAKIYE